jgi:Skp family chaperone for outer membrane proteins
MKSRTKSGYIISLLLCTLVAIGCSQDAADDQESSPDETTQSSRGSGIAIVDLDAIALRLGRIDEINQSLQTQAAQFDIELQNQRTQSQTAFDTQEAAYGESPTPEQEAELRLLLRELNAQYAQSQQNVAAALAQLKAQRIDEFKQDVTPIALGVAREHGLSIVVPKNRDLLLAFEPELEITDDVVQAMGGEVTSSIPVSPDVATAQTNSESPLFYR